MSRPIAVLAVLLATSPVLAQSEDEFTRTRRAGSVDIAAEYDLNNLEIPEEEIHTLLPRDAIPALTDPKLEDAADADWLAPGARVIAIEVGGEAVAAPLQILTYHEIVNLSVGGEPVAATYCPLCDSATLFSRRTPTGETGDDGQPETVILEFGVSGALYNSNVLMYDRTHKGLWSQLAMRAVSGPMAGTELEHLPVRVVSWKAFKSEFPDARVVSRETGHERPYEGPAYAAYFATDDLLVPVRGIGDALAKKKTLGLGVMAGGESWFIPAEVIADGYTLETPAGPVVARATEAGVEVLSAPGGVHTAQTYYYSWSAFNKHTRVLTE